jgi:hypothetical protein
MTPGEIISTIITVLALVVTWLARLDSKKSADAAQRTADLMARRLELATEEQKRKLEKERSESEPLFKWGGGHGTPQGNGWVTFREFKNEGGQVTELSIKVNDATNNLRADILPKNHLGKHEGGSISLAQDGSNVLPNFIFEIHYTTHLKERSMKRFSWSASDGPKELK